MKKFNFSKGLVIGLLTLALCLTCFGVAKVSAEEAATETKTTAVAAEYNAATDEITAGSNAYVYVVKAATGNKIKAGQAATGQMESNKISLADLGIKSTKKDVFLYVCDKEVEVKDGETVAANLVIKGNAIKVVGVVDYTQADLGAESVSVLSAYYTDKATKKTVSIESAKLVWSSDKETWYGANDETEGRKDANNADTSNGFNGADLAGMLEAGGTIYLKQLGTSGASGTATFGSAVAKVKIAKQAKAPKAKVDVAKDTIALKNGFDFALVGKNATTNEYTDIYQWYTILPTLKTATISSEGDSIVGGMHGEKATVYKPLDKKNTNAGKEVKNDGDENYYYSYTKYAVKALSIDKLFEIVDLNYATAGIDLPEDFQIAIRKSATDKKPASAFSTVELGLKTKAPIVWTESNVEGQFLVASADEFTKKGLTLGEIAGFAGYTGTSPKAIATEGFDSTFKLTAASDSIKDRDEGTAFEYAVVATADYAATGDAAIDWTTVKWKKLDPSKLKITEKLSGKYNTVKGAKKTATLKSTTSGDISVGSEKTESDAYGRTVVKESVIESDTKALLLIRRAGDKASGTRASEFIALYVAKEGKKYNLYSTVSNGEQAKHYNVYFFKYDAGSATKTAGFYRDDSIEPISGWTRNAKTGIQLESLTNAEYFKLGAASTTAGNSLGMASLGETPVKYVAKTAETAVAATDTDDATTGTDAIPAGWYEIDVEGEFGSDPAINIAIREFANVKVKTAAYVGNDAVGAGGQVVASVVNGIEQSYGTSFTTPDDGVVSVYVGTETSIVLKLVPSLWTAPTGYVKASNMNPTIVDGTGFVKAAENSYSAPQSGAQIKVTINTAEEVEITLKYQVVKTYTITVDGNGGSWEAGTKKTYTTDHNETLPTEASNLFTNGAGIEPPTGKVFKELNTAADGSGDKVTDGKKFTADTTIYVIYKDAE